LKNAWDFIILNETIFYKILLIYLSCTLGSLTNDSELSVDEMKLGKIKKRLFDQNSLLKQLYFFLE